MERMSDPRCCVMIEREEKEGRWEILHNMDDHLVGPQDNRPRRDIIYCYPRPTRWEMDTG